MYIHVVCGSLCTLCTRMMSYFISRVYDKMRLLMLYIIYKQGERCTCNACRTLRKTKLFRVSLIQLLNVVSFFFCHVYSYYTACSVYITESTHV